MRSIVFSLALAIATVGMVSPASHAATQDQNQARAIAKSLKQSGQLKDYRVGVKYKDGVAWLTGTVTSEHQKQLAEQIAQNCDGVAHIVSKLKIERADLADALADDNVETASRLTTQRRRAVPRKAASNMPVPYARTGQQVQPTSFNRTASFCPSGQCGTMGPGVPGATGQAVGYDNPQMPGYAWPSYAAAPNYAALTYPKQYSASAWPYIGPFYPYPQVPLGWRKVTLEWDDGWWFLDFKDSK